MAQTGPTHWPIGEEIFAVQGWQLGPAVMPSETGGAETQRLSRSYQRPDGARASLSLLASPEPAPVYKSSPIPLSLQNGFRVEPAPLDLVPPSPGRAAAVLRGVNSEWVLLYTYGDRSGLVGNGARAWGLAALDMVRLRPNEHFMATVVTPLGQSDPAAMEQTLQLADVLFQRLAAWYAR